MSLVTVHRAICFSYAICLPYINGYIAINTTKRKQFKHDNMNKAFTSCWTTRRTAKAIENVARCSDFCLLNNMEIARKLAAKPYCRNFQVFDRNVYEHPK